MNYQASRKEIDYSVYAESYDVLCGANPAYQELLSIFQSWLRSSDLSKEARVLDVGAGTGNFLIATSEVLEDARLTHVDCNQEMNLLAQKKYSSSSIEAEIIEGYMQNVNLPERSYDLVVCVNALNNAPPVFPMLSRFERWLDPEGYLFLIDFGRKLKMLDWGTYLIQESLKTQGFMGTFELLKKTRKAISSNSAGRRDQASGSLWTHTTIELQTLAQKAGFVIHKTDLCYRGYADLLICQSAKI